MDTTMEQRLNGSWNQVKGRIREAWGALSDDDVDRYDGQVDQLIGRIQDKTGEARESIRKKLNEIADAI